MMSDKNLHIAFLCKKKNNYICKEAKQKHGGNVWVDRKASKIGTIRR